MNSLNKTDYLDIYDEKIDSICLKGIVNSSCKDEKINLDEKYREFGEKLISKIYAGEDKSLKQDGRIYDILGADDFRLIARDVSLGKILREFGRGGLLNYYEDVFPSYLFSSSLVLNTIGESGFRKTNSENIGGYETPFCDELEEKMTWILNVIEDMKNMEDKEEPYWDTTAAMCSGIWQLLQSLKALERPKTKKYDFMTIFVPLRQMIFILESKIKNEGTQLILKNRSKIFDFLYKISMTLHGTLRTDIQFFQIRDFNAVIHYAPAKLRAFYSLWALELSNYYSLFCDKNTKKTYSFILSPGMFPEVGVKQLFDNDEDKHRLMLITLPERQLYTVQKLSIMLGHEVSHFVGTDVKCRDERCACLVKVVTRILTLEINRLRYEGSDIEYKNEMERSIAESHLYERLIQLLLKENALLDKKDSVTIFHSEKTILHIKNLFDSFLNKYTELVTGEDCEYYYQSYKNAHLETRDGYEKKAIVINKAKKQSYEKEKDIQNIIQKFSGKLDSFLGTILNEVLREACADISSILTLELTPKEYIESFCNNGIPDEELENVENIITEKEIRISLVIKSIQKEIAGKKSCFIYSEFFEAWQTFSIEKFIKENTGNREAEFLGYKIFLCFLIKKDKNTRISEYQSAYNKDKGYFSGEVLDFYTDDIVWTEMRQYIDSCIKEYLRRFSEDNTLLLQKKRFLINVYKSVAVGSVGKQIQVIENFLYSCEDNFYQNVKSD